MKIAYIAVGQRDLRDVCDPQLVGCKWTEAGNQIFPFVIPVVGIRCMPRLRLRKNKASAAENRKETVSARDKVTAKHAYEHKPQFVTANAWILRADFQDGIYNITLMF